MCVLAAERRNIWPRCCSHFLMRQLSLQINSKRDFISCLDQKHLCLERTQILCVLDVKSLFVAYQSCHGPEEKPEFFCKYLWGTFKGSLILAKAQYFFTRLEHSILECDSSFIKVSQMLLHLIHTTWSLQIHLLMMSDVLRTIQYDVF